MFHDLIWSSVQPAFRNLIVSGGRNAALLFVGLSAGGIIAAGVFAVTTIVALIGCVMIRRRSNLRIRQLHKKESE